MQRERAVPQRRGPAPLWHGDRGQASAGAPWTIGRGGELLGRLTLWAYQAGLPLWGPGAVAVPAGCPECGSVAVVSKRTSGGFEYRCVDCAWAA